MEYYINERVTHPLEFRVKLLERYLEEAINILQAKVRANEACVMGAWIEEASAVLNHEEA